MVHLDGTGHSDLTFTFKLNSNHVNNTCTIDGDGTVGVSDLLVVLAEWGPCPLCQGDLDADGHVGVNDLLVVISSWGSCN